MAMEVYFVTGTGTDVGKTYCASRFVETCRREGKQVAVYKPVESGCSRGEAGDWIAVDAVKLWQAADCPLTVDEVCPQRFAAPLAPPQAAFAEESEVDEALLLSGVDVWTDRADARRTREHAAFDVLVIEGAGGLFSPISTSWLNADFALQLRHRLPEIAVVLIARNRLGVIHECVATVRAAVAAGLTIDKIVLNEFETDVTNGDESIATNAAQIEQWTGCSVTQQIGLTPR